LRRTILLMICCLILIVSACSGSEEDTQEYSGIINEGKVMGYEYTVTKEQNVISWNIGYKGETSIFEESTANEDYLQNFMTNINSGEMTLVTLIISLSYFFIVILTALILFKKNRKILKESGVIIFVLAGIALYFAFEAYFDLSISLKEAKYYYLLLTN